MLKYSVFITGFLCTMFWYSQTHDWFLVHNVLAIKHVFIDGIHANSNNYINDNHHIKLERLKLFVLLKVR